MAADAALLEIIPVVVAVTIAAEMDFLAEITAVSGSLSYCSSSPATIIMTAIAAATMAAATVSLAETTMAANGLSGSSCFPASAETTMAAANPFKII